MAYHFFARYVAAILGHCMDELLNTLAFNFP